MNGEPVTLDGIARDLRRIERDQADMRTEATMHGAILRRVEAAVVALVEELRGR